MENLGKGCQAILGGTLIGSKVLLDSLHYTRCLKNCANLLLSELRQISTNFDNYWQKDGKGATIM